VELLVPATKIKEIYQFASITLDWTAENKGSEAELGRLLQDYRRRIWQEHQALGTHVAEFQELIIKGCNDHASSLISRHFNKKVEEIFENWKIELAGGKSHQPITTYSPAAFLQRMARKLSELRKVFHGFLMSKNIATFSIPRVQPTRHITFKDTTIS